MNITNHFVIGIDATNIRQGGGVTHLVELLNSYRPLKINNIRVILWGSSYVLDKINNRDWLEKISFINNHQGLIKRTVWQLFNLPKSAKQKKCNILFVPGGSYYGFFYPFVSMHRNLLPFELKEIKRYGLSPIASRLLLLRFIQTWTFNRSNGVIFLTKYSEKIVSRSLKNNSNHNRIIAHGLNSKFMMSPKPQYSINNYSKDKPFKLIYVSIVDLYKHQWHVIKAIHLLRKKGFPLTIDLIGGFVSPALVHLNKAIMKYDPNKEWIKYHGELPYDTLNETYKESDLAIFASSCESISNILLEKMASGMPIACSSYGPLPEVLGDGGIYFDPENPNDIMNTIERLIIDPDLRTQKVKIINERSKSYSWEACAEETFSFLCEVAEGSSKNQ